MILPENFEDWQIGTNTVDLPFSEIVISVYLLYTKYNYTNFTFSTTVQKNCRSSQKHITRRTTNDNIWGLKFSAGSSNLQLVLSFITKFFLSFILLMCEIKVQHHLNEEIII